MEALILSSLPDGLVVWERGDKRKAQEIKAKKASKVSLRREPHRPPRRGEGRRRYCRLSEATHAQSPNKIPIPAKGRQLNSIRRKTAFRWYL